MSKSIGIQSPGLLHHPPLPSRSSRAWAHPPLRRGHMLSQPILVSTLSPTGPIIWWRRRSLCLLCGGHRRLLVLGVIVGLLRCSWVWLGVLGFFSQKTVNPARWTSRGGTTVPIPVVTGRKCSWAGGDPGLVNLDCSILGPVHLHNGGWAQARDDLEGRGG